MEGKFPQEIDPLEEKGSLEDSLDFFESEIQQERRERELILKIASSSSLDGLLEEIMDYLQERWGFNAFQVQLVNNDNNTLELYKYYGMERADQRINNAIGIEVSLENSKDSVSAYVARKKKVVYADYESTHLNNRMSAIDREAIEAIGVIENLILPIIENDEVIGVMHLLSLKQRLNLNREVIADIEKFIKGVSGLIQTSKRKEELERSKKRQDKIIKLIKTISRTIDVEKLLSLFADELAEKLRFDGVLVSLVDEVKENLVCEMVRLPKEYYGIEKTYRRFKLPLNSSDASVDCYKTGKSRIYDREAVSKYKETTKYQFDGWKMKSMLVSPICIDDEPFGVVMVFSQEQDYDVHHFDYIEDILQLFLEQIRSSVIYTRLREQERHIKDATRLNQEFLGFITKVNNLTSIDLIYKMFSEEILSRFGFDFASVYMRDGKDIVFKKLSYVDKGFKTEFNKLHDFMSNTYYSLDMRDGSMPVAIIKNIRVFIPDVQEVMHLPMSEKDKASIEILGTNRTVLQVPIRMQNHPIGVLGLFGLTKVVDLSEMDLQVIELLCSFMGTIISNAELYSTVGSQRDELETTIGELKKTQKQLVETERKRAEAMKSAKEVAEASAEAKSNFLANMSHEIRTPLNAVIGLSKLALKTNLDDKQYDYLWKIDRSSETLLGIINDILDFSKIEAGKLKIENVDFSLFDSMGLIVDMFADRVSEKGIEMIVSISDDIPPVLNGDPLRLNQILINLVGNAIKFTDSGEVEISVVMLEREGDYASLEFVVRDTGIGMKRETITSLFESFTQADGSTTRKFGGTGLGLSICKSLVEMMGGNIWADSQVDIGSTFCFTSKLKLSDKNMIEPIEDSNQKLVQKILVIDDSKLVCIYFEKLLKGMGINVDYAMSGEEAVKKAQSSKGKNKYELIFSDWKMPGIDGIETIKQIKEIKGYSCVPMVMMTAYSNEDFRFNAGSYGVEIFLDKPLRQKEVLEVIHKVSGTDNEMSVNFSPATISNDMDNVESISGARVLLIEDNEINQQVAVELLEDAFMYVDVVSNGRDGLELLNSDRVYDLVLTDIQMPDIDGYQVSREIRKNEKLNNIPIIALTADAMTGDKEKCLQAGMNDHIPKPINVSLLYSVISKWLPKVDRLPNIKAKNSEYGEYDVLPGVDIDKSLERLGGNRYLLDKIITDFCKEYKNVFEKISVKYHSGDKSEARIITHTLKGVIGTFSTSVIHAAAIHLDDVVKRESDNEFAVALEKLSKAVNPIYMSGKIIQKIKYKSSVEEMDKVERKEISALDLDSLLKKGELFKELIDMNNYGARDIFYEIRDELKGTALTEIIEDIEESLYKFDFDTVRHLYQNIDNALHSEVKNQEQKKNKQKKA